MTFVKQVIFTTVALSIGSSATASITIPAGLQSNVSQATVDSWGWTEIHRSSATQQTSEAAIVAAATGNYLMMGVWDNSRREYSILGAGSTSAVTAITYQNYSSDDNGNLNPNFSNGLNFYRTTTNGSWGFTTNTVTDLRTADVFLSNGLLTSSGNAEGTLSKGLSFHTDGGNLTAGWAFNATGSNYTGIYDAGRYERVFFTVNASVPEPATLFVWSLLGLTAGAISYQRRRRQAVGAEG